MSGLIFKVFAVSTLLSIAIKYGGPALPVMPTTPTVLIAVLLPSAVIAMILGWRSQQGVR